jgi:hypothetical protein
MYRISLPPQKNTPKIFNFYVPTMGAPFPALSLETFHYWWRVKSSFKLVWMESTLPCNSLIGYSLKWRCYFIGLTKISFVTNWL